MKNNTKIQKGAVLISPSRFPPRSGGAEYTKRALMTIGRGYKEIYVIRLKGYPLNIPSDGEYEISGFGGAGILFLEFNLDYLAKVFRLIRLVKKKWCNKPVDIQVLLNGPFGAIVTYVISKIIGAESVYIAHNVEKERCFTESVTYNEKRILPILKWIIALLEYLATKFGQIIAISHEDKKKFMEMYNVSPEKIVVVPPKIPEIYFLPRNKPNKKADTPVVVFHGTYTYLPNREGMELIRKYISKRIRHAQFVVFGSNAPQFAKDNFKSFGFVDDLYEFLSSCDIAIVPLKRGSGVKLKILDYMAVGLPIVTTKKGAEGLELVNGKHATIVDDVDEEFIKAIEQLIENPKLRRKMGYNIKKLAMKKYKVTWNGG